MDAEDLYNQLRGKLDTLYREHHITSIQHDAFMNALEVAYEDSDDYLNELIEENDLQ